MAIDSFGYTEPVGGIDFRSYSSGGVHVQAFVLAGEDTLALPTDATYGLSVDIKRIAADATIMAYLTDPTDSTLQAAVLDEDTQETDTPGLAMRSVGLGKVADVDVADLLRQQITLLQRMCGTIENYLGGPSEFIGDNDNA